MIKNILLVCILIFGKNSYSHGESKRQRDHSGHDWRGDTKAYQSVKPHHLFSNNKGYSFFNLTAIDRFLELLNTEFIDMEFFRDKLSEFVGEKKVFKQRRILSLPKKRCTPEQMKPITKYLIEEYQKLGYKAQSLGDYDQEILNFMALKKGRDSSKTLIISSHTDNVCNNGVNDDATGTISALTIAKAIAKLNLKYNVLFVGFDREEDGLIGSRAFVKNNIKNPSSIIADIQIEMLGTDSDRDGVFHVIDCNRTDSNSITNMIARNILENKIPVKINEGCTTRSDHSSFWNANIPAVVVSENFFGGDSDRCYHRNCDVLDERLDFTYMGFITEALARTVIQISNGAKL